MKLLPICAMLALTCATLQAAARCACGPAYCTGTAAYTEALAKKKKAAKDDGVPARLIALYDKLDRCEASIKTSPDGMSILHQQADGTIVIDSWTPENERNDAAAVAAGTMKACYVIISRKAFACCGATPAEERSDYDKELELNKSAALKCDKAARRQTRKGGGAAAQKEIRAQTDSSIKGEIC
jgi:hypothetical protein